MSFSYPINLCYTSPGGISYGEFVDGWTVNLANGTAASGGTIKRIVKWSDAATYITELLFHNNYVSGSFTYFVGQQHPIYVLFCTAVVQKPLTGVSDAESTFDYAELTITYSSLPYNPSSPSTVYRASIESVGQVIVLPKECTFVGGGTQSIVYDENIYIPAIKLNVTLLGVNYVPLSAISSCTNMVSNSDFNFSYGGSSFSIPGDQVLYQPGGSTQTTMSNGVTKYDVTHSFLISSLSLNKVFDHTSMAPNILDRYVLPTDSSGNVIYKYKSADYSGLGL